MLSDPDSVLCGVWSWRVRKETRNLDSGAKSWVSKSAVAGSLEERMQENTAGELELK